LTDKIAYFENLSLTVDGLVFVGLSGRFAEQYHDQ